MTRTVRWFLVVMMVASAMLPIDVVRASEGDVPMDDMSMGSTPQVESEVPTAPTDATQSPTEPTQPVAEVAMNAVAALAPQSFVAMTPVGIEEDSMVSRDIVPLAPISAKQLVISYVQASGVYGKSVELRNVSGEDYSSRKLSLQYIKASDLTAASPVVLATFYGTIKAGGSVAIGDGIIEGSEVQSADVYFDASSTIMSPSGGWLILVDDTTELDSFCWSDTSKLCGDDYYAPLPFKNHQAYERCYDAGLLVRCHDGSLPFHQVGRRDVRALGGFVPFYNRCNDVRVSEVAPSSVDQFIELENVTDQPVSLEKCMLQVGSTVHEFAHGDVLAPYSLTPLTPSTLGVSLAKTTANTIRVLASDGEVVDSFSYGTPQDARSVIMVNEREAWTYAMTPGMENRYLRYLPCEDGYVRNEETGRCGKIVSEPSPLTDCGEGRERNPASGRCRNIVTTNTLAPCKEGQYRSEETNRCRSIATAASVGLKPCADDQFRNPETGRCKKIASSEELALADCGEGRERNPETNRCRNTKTVASIPDAAFAVEPVKDTAQAFVGWWALGGVGMIALGYGVWEWRRELAGMLAKIGTFFHSGK